MNKRSGVRLIAGRAVGDPEKAVLPVIMWTSVGNGRAVACALSLGWWDFHVTVAWLFADQTQDKRS